MKISKQVAQDLLELWKVGQSSWDKGWPEDFPVKFEYIQDELVDTTRWSHVHERVYKDLQTDKFYLTSYRTSATECQDEAPYEYDQEVELEEVVPVEHTVIKYEVVN